VTTTEFNILYQGMHKDLAARAMNLTHDKTNAEDLLQETLMRSYENLHQYRDDRNFKGWMLTIMRNAFINNYRKNKLRRTLEMPDVIYGEIGEATTMNETANGSILCEELTQFVSNLPDVFRIPFEMNHTGYRYKEIAKATNVPLGTVKSRIFFARKYLKEAIAKNYQESLFELGSL